MLLRLSLLRPALVAAALLFTALPAVRAQQLDATFEAPELLQPAAVSHVAVQADGKRLLTTRALLVGGQLANGVVRYNADGTLDQAFTAAVQGYIWQPTFTLPLASGKLLVVCGEFGAQIQAGGLRRRTAVRLNADGSVDASFDLGTANNGTVHAAAEQANGQLLLGGNISQFAGTAVNDLVRVSATGALDASFAAPQFWSTQAIETILVQPDGKVLIGGNLPAATASYHVARLLATGAVDPAFQLTSTTDPQVQALALQANGNILVAAGNTLRRLLPDGAPDAAFTKATVQHPITGLVVLPDGKTLISGHLGNVNGTAVGGVARLLPDGTPDAAFQLPPALTSTPLQPLGLVRQPDGRLLLGLAVPAYPTGRLTEPVSALLLEATGARSGSWQPELQQRGVIRSVALQPDGAILIGGAFSVLGTQPVANLARLRPGGALDTAFTRRAAVDAEVRGVAWQPGASGGVVAAGSFQHQGSTACRPLVRLQPSGQLDASFAYQPDGLGAVTTLGVDNTGAILTQTTGGSADQLLRWQANGQPDAAYTRSFSDNLLRTWPLADGRHLVLTMSEDISTFGLTSLRRLLPSGAPDPTFTPVEFQAVNIGLLIDAVGTDAQGRPLVAVLHDTPSGYVYRLLRFPASGGSTPDPTFTAPPLSVNDDWIQAIAVQPDGRILLAGQHGLQSRSLWRLQANGAADPSFDLDVAGLADQVLLQPDGKILLSGQDLLTPNIFDNFGVVRITGTVTAAAAARPEIQLGAWPVPAHDVLHVALDAQARPQRLTLLDATGRAVRTQPLGVGTEARVPVQGLPAGVYLLRVDYAQGSVSRRVQVQ